MKKNKKDKSLFYLKFVTDKDEIKENEEKINNLTEKQKSEFVYKGYNFYELGVGHDFVFGFFTEYITKNGIKAWRYHYSGMWNICGEKYDWDNINSVFIVRQKPEVNTEHTKWDEIQFPKVKKLSGPIGLKLPSVYPKNKPNENK